MEDKDSEYNHRTSIHQPQLFDFFTDEELEIELIEAGDPDEKYIVDINDDDDDIEF
jgi:hypothetical protein